MALTPLPKINPDSPDLYIKALGSKKAQAALARMAHLNPIIDRVNLLADLIDSTTTGITAFAGGGQTNATQLTSTYNEVTIVASAGDSVKLLPAEEGLKQVVKNDGTNSLAVFPSTGDTIDDGAANASVTLAPGATVTFVAVDGTNWETSDKAISVGGTLFVDAVFGNDTTAKPYNPAYAYATIAAAVTAATSGDIIWLRPGTYAPSTNIMKDGVSFYADPGVIMAGTALIFNADTTAGGTTFTLPWYFLGHATFFHGAAALLMSVATNPSADIYIQADALTTFNNSNSIIVKDGKARVDVVGDFIAGGRNIRMEATGNIQVNVGGEILCTANSAAAACFYSTNTFNWSGYAHIKARAMRCTNPAGAQPVVHLSGTAAGSKLFIELEDNVDAAAVSAPFLEMLNVGGQNTSVILKAKRFSMDARALFVKTDGSLFVNIDECSLPFSGATNNSGTVFLQSCRISNTFPIAIVAGTAQIYNCYINSAAAGNSPVTQAAGTLSIMGSTLVSAGVAASIDNPAGTTISEASKGNVAPTVAVTGNFYVNAAYTL